MTPRVACLASLATLALAGPPPAWMRGAWTRDWIELHGARTNTLDVHYLQTPRFFADVRIPLGRPRFAAARSFDDLSDADLRLLARQRGFTGPVTAAGDTVTWQHDIDFQPPDGSADIGLVERVGSSRMFERGLDGAYVESWHSLGNGNGRFLVVRVERARRLEWTLVVAGDRFLYVRNRRADLPMAPSFDWTTQS